jgi:chromosome segregation ATPase
VSDEKTQNLTDGRSFEERVFARFDALDARMGGIEARLDDMDARLQTLEQKSYDTKPIWERALAEILALGDRMHSLERKFNVLGRDMLTLRGDQERVEDRMDRLESKPAQ